MIEFFNEKRTSSKIMMISIMILFFSQFLPYFEDAPLVSGFETIYVVPGRYATGWDLHPYAVYAIIVLAFIFFKDDISSHAYFFPYGWLVCLGIFFYTISPGAPFRATGAAFGGVSFCLACFAFWVRRKESDYHL